MDFEGNMYIFVSHSQNDIKEARRIRDYLESRSFEPILFNLKCLTDSDDLSSLIKREIKTRKWFLYLDSRNARNSSRVHDEVTYAEALNKKVFKVNLDAVWPIQKIALNRIMEKMRSEK